jgi:c-di-GMP-binding flagellar brake protein YcgR
MKYGFIKQEGQYIYYVLGPETDEEKYGFAVIDFSESGPFFNNISFFEGEYLTKFDFKRISNTKRKKAIEIVFKRL